MASSATTQSTTAGAKSSLPKEKQLLELPGVKVKASSMLNDDEDTYGPMNLLDGKAETCWNSDQGGFAAKCCQALLKPASKSDLPVEFDAVYPQDLNNPQEFKLFASASEAARIGGTRLRLTLSQQADFYGRVILYSVQVKGTIATGAHST